MRRIGVLGDSRALPCVRLTWRWSNGFTRASSDSASAVARGPDARGDCLVPDLRIDLADEGVDKWLSSSVVNTDPAGEHWLCCLSPDRVGARAGLGRSGELVESSGLH